MQKNAKCEWCKVELVHLETFSKDQWAKKVKTAVRIFSNHQWAIIKNDSFKMLSKTDPECEIREQAENDDDFMIRWCFNTNDALIYIDSN